MISQDDVCSHISGLYNICGYQMESSFIKFTYVVSLIFILSVDGFYERLNNRGFTILTYFHFA